MDPKIRYTKSADGVNIAYWAIGDGRPLVYLPPMTWSHIEREWAIPELRRRYERLAVGRRLIRYDARGFGLSDLHPSDVTLAAHSNDLQAVLKALAIEECDLFGLGDGGFTAIEFCARAPERVGKLILWGSYANRDFFASDPRVKSFRALWDEDWHQYTEMVMRTIFGWKHEDRASQLADFYRASASPESLRNVVDPLNRVDLTPLLPSVHVPTLVVAIDNAWIDARDESRRLAAVLPNAELKTVSGQTIYFDFSDDEDTVVTVVNDFLGGPTLEAPSDDQASSNPSAFRAILFTDLVGHTEMMSRLGDEMGREVLREHERITREVLAANGGTEVKTMGDGFMASFGSVTKAVECAVALQRKFEVRSAKSEVESLSVRCGLNVGEPIEEDGDLFGATVILASRIAAKAEGGEILVANAVRELCAGKGFLFSDRGDFNAKGFDEAVRVYEVKWREE